jgi:hypothetical protein
MYTNQAIHHGPSTYSRENPWSAVEKHKSEVPEASLMQMQALSNDFNIESSSLKLERQQDSPD